MVIKHISNFDPAGTIENQGISVHVDYDLGFAELNGQFQLIEKMSNLLMVMLILVLCHY